MGLGGRRSALVWAWRRKLETLLSDLRFVLRRREEGHSVEVGGGQRAMKEIYPDWSLSPTPWGPACHSARYNPDLLQTHASNLLYLRIALLPRIPQFTFTCCHPVFFFCFSLPLPVTLPPPFLPQHIHTHTQPPNHFPSPPPSTLHFHRTQLSLCVPHRNIKLPGIRPLSPSSLNQTLLPRFPTSHTHIHTK